MINHVLPWSIHTCLSWACLPSDAVLIVPLFSVSSGEKWVLGIFQSALNHLWLCLANKNIGRTCGRRGKKRSQVFFSFLLCLGRFLAIGFTFSTSSVLTGQFCYGSSFHQVTLVPKLREENLFSLSLQPKSRCSFLLLESLDSCYFLIWLSSSPLLV